MTAVEAEALAGYLDAQRQRLADGSLAATELMAVDDASASENDSLREAAAWMLVARAVMNLDEAIVKR